jgi:hypothetical protein
MSLESTADDLIHTEPFLFSSQEVTEGKRSPEGDLLEDEAVKWLDQFIVRPKCFVKGKDGCLTLAGHSHDLTIQLMCQG